MNTLPSELVEKILVCFNCFEECSGILRMVCRKWKSIIDRTRPPKTLITWVKTVSSTEWALRNGCPRSILNCDYAAKYNHLELLVWFRSKCFCWNQGTCLIAATYGNLEILQYLRANECPWNEYTCYWASEKHSNVEDLILANLNCPLSFNLNINNTYDV
jgi:hypothetical protein